MLLNKTVRVAFAILLFRALTAFSQNLPIAAGPARVPVVTGQIIVADGTKLSESVEVQIICGGRLRTELYSDRQGNFTFDLEKLAGISGPQSADASTTTPSLSYGSGWEDCSARAVLPGFSSESVEFLRHLHELGIVDIGKIRLHPLNANAKTSLSVSSLLAPKSAQKAMERGLNLARQGKSSEAEQVLRQAVEIYPDYAAAWSELGSMQYAQQNFSAARESFQRAVEIDPQYVRPYLGLVQLAVDSHNWPEAVRISNKALSLDSVSYPAVWLLNAAAQYNLRNYDAAENSVRNGARVDTEHRINEFQALGMRIASAKNADASRVGLSPHVRFGINKRVWDDSDPLKSWLN
jgi:tetratricopeptide (TPR) repeat protein